MTTLQPVGGLLAAPPAPAAQSTQVAPGGLFACLLALLSDQSGGEPGLAASVSELPLAPELKDSPERPAKRIGEPEAVERSVLAWALAAGFLSAPSGPVQPQTHDGRPASPAPEGATRPVALPVPNTELASRTPAPESAPPAHAEIELPEFSPRLWNLHAATAPAAVAAPDAGATAPPGTGRMPLALPGTGEPVSSPLAGSTAVADRPGGEANDAGLLPAAGRLATAQADDLARASHPAITPAYTGATRPGLDGPRGAGHPLLQASTVDVVPSTGHPAAAGESEASTAELVASARQAAPVLPSESASPPEMDPARHRELASLREATPATAHLPGLAVDRAAAQTVGSLDAADREPAAPSREPDGILPQVVHQIRFSVRNGLNQAWVRLEPPSLGTVDVRLTESGGMLQVVLASPNPVVRELLQRGSDGLRRELAASGLQVQRIEVTGPLGVAESSATSGHPAAAGHGGDWGQPAGRQPEQAWPAPQPYPREARPESDPDPLRLPRQRGQSDSRIDYWA